MTFACRGIISCRVSLATSLIEAAPTAYLSPSGPTARCYRATRQPSSMLVNYFFNWNRSADTLETHAERFMLNPNVMDANWPELLERLRADSSYLAAFKAAYADGLNKANVLDAMAAYERSLNTPNSRFDQYLRGRKKPLPKRNGAAINCSNLTAASLAIKV